MASELVRFLERARRLEGQLERLANDFFLSESFCETTYGSLWRPPSDVYETDTDVVIRIEVPGLHVEDIGITLHGHILVVRAVRRDCHLDAKKTYHQLEIHYGLFERVIPLPRRIVGDEAKGAYTDGFLLITIPKSEEPTELTEIVRLHI